MKKTKFFASLLILLLATILGPTASNWQTSAVELRQDWQQETDSLGRIRLTVPDNLKNELDNSASSNLIHSEIEKVIAETDRQTATKSVSGDANDDLIIYLQDKQGALLSPTNSKTAAETSVADNFIFDELVPQHYKDIFLKAYPLIEQVYGKRSTTIPISVVRPPTTTRGYYLPSENQIILDKTERDDEPIHELVHAFRYIWCLPSLWEEGSAIEITNYIEQKLKMPIDPYNQPRIAEGYKLLYENQPSTYDPDINNAWTPWKDHLPYQVGSSLLDRVFLDNPNFFKTFNAKLYARFPNGAGYRGGAIPTGSQILELAVASAVTIEGQPSPVWFANQYPYLDLYPSDKTYFAVLDPIVYQNNSNNSSVAGDYFLFGIRSNYNLTGNDINIRFLDEQNNVLIGSSQFTNKWKNRFQMAKLCTNLGATYKNYQGLVKVEMTPTANPANQVIQSFLKIRKPVGSADVYATSPKGQMAVFADLQNPTNSLIVARVNRYFSASAAWVKTSGRFKVTFYNRKASCSPSTLTTACLGARVNEKYFNKTIMSDFLAQAGEDNSCAATISNIRPLNQGFSLLSTSSRNCGQVVVVNGQPKLRYWGKRFSLKMTALLPVSLYRFQVLLQANLSRVSSLTGQVKTLP